MRSLEPFAEPIYVTRPLLPDLGQVQGELEQIWESQWLTNHGVKHNTLQTRLAGVLKAPHVSLFNNGTVALLVALKALELPPGSEVITTPFTFPATPHSITWNGLRPVFCDITPDSMVLDAARLEDLITPRTSAILGVHVYGLPCDVHQIQKIADRHGLKVVYDAAHAFATEIDGQGIGSFGDISMFSFHATKLFHTLEGGCLCHRDPALVDRIYLLRNFGIANEESVVDVGINGKMNEIQAAIGLLNIELFEAERGRRLHLRRLYERRLRAIPGLVIPALPGNVTDSCQYFVLRVESERFGLSRDQLHLRLKRRNVHTRKYFFPLCSECPPYGGALGAGRERLRVAERVQGEVLCLPFYGGLGEEAALRICDMIQHCHRTPHEE